MFQFRKGTVVLRGSGCHATLNGAARSRLGARRIGRATRSVISACAGDAVLDQPHPTQFFPLLSFCLDHMEPLPRWPAEIIVLQVHAVPMPSSRGLLPTSVHAVFFFHSQLAYLFLQLCFPLH